MLVFRDLAPMEERASTLTLGPTPLPGMRQVHSPGSPAALEHADAQGGATVHEESAGMQRGDSASDVI